MKNIILVLCICILAMILSACGKNEIAIEDCQWKLESATNIDSNSKVSVGDIVLTLRDGEIIINDVTNMETYKGAYEEMLVTDDENDYKIFLEGKEGNMSLTETENGEKNLLLTVDDYDLCFLQK